MLHERAGSVLIKQAVLGAFTIGADCVKSAEVLSMSIFSDNKLGFSQFLKPSLDWLFNSN